MKLRKQSKTYTRNKDIAGVNMPEDLNNQPADQQAPNLPAEHGPREIEAPEDHSFRDFLKDQLPRFKASPGLTDKILSSIEKDSRKD